MGEPIAKANGLELGPRPRESVRFSGQFERDGDVLQRRHCGDQLERLKNDPYVLATEARQIVFGHCVQVASADPNQPGVGTLQSGEGHEQRRFSRAGRPQKADGFTTADCEGDALQNVHAGRPVAEREIDPGEFNDILHGDFPLKTLFNQLRLRAARHYSIHVRRHRLIIALAAVFSIMGASCAPAMAATVATKRIVVFGDSLSAGYGLAAADALPAQLEKRLRAAGRDVIVVNAGVSGDTTATGVERLDYTLGGEKFDVAIIELGANDMLRGLDPKAARANIEKMILAFRGKGTEVMLAVMVSSDNWGQTYKKEFDSIYPELASRYGVALVPFMMAGVWGDPKLLIGDGLHPNAAGVARMTDVLAPPVQNLLASMTAGAPAGK